MDLSGRVARNTLVQLLGRGFTMLVSLVALMILVRALGPEGIGNYLLVLSVIALLNVSDLGFTDIGVRELSAGKERADVLLGNMILIRIALAAVAIALASASAFLLGYSSEVAFAISLASLSYLFLALGQGSFGLTFAANLRMEFQVAGNVAQALVFIALVGVVVQGDLGLIALVLAYDISILVNAVVTFYFSRAFLTPRFEVDPVLCRRLIVQSVPLAITHVGWLAYSRIDIVMLSKLEGLSAVGLYGVAYRFVDIIWPMNFLFVMSVYPLLTRYVSQGDQPKFRSMLQRSFDALSIMIIPVAAVLIVFAEPLLVLIGSSEFRPAAPALRLLSLAIVLQWGASLFSHSLISVNKQGSLPLIMLSGVFLNVVLNLFLIPRHGITGAALSTLITDVVLFTCLTSVVWKHIHFLPSFTVAGKIAAVAVAASAATLLFIPDNLILRGLFLALCLVAGSAAVRVVAMSDIREVIQRTVARGRSEPEEGMPIRRATVPPASVGETRR